jgi:hypothetical protein
LGTARFGSLGFVGVDELDAPRRPPVFIRRARDVIGIVVGDELREHAEESVGRVYWSSGTCRDRVGDREESAINEAAGIDEKRESGVHEPRLERHGVDPGTWREIRARLTPPAAISSRHSCRRS